MFSSVRPITIADLERLYHQQQAPRAENHFDAEMENVEEGDAERSDGGGVDIENAHPEEASSPRRRAKKKKEDRTAVLGSQTLGEYAKDRANMVLPPWISAPPARAGHTDHGKLSADQWRVLCTVSLPITLIRLWGTEDEDSRWRKMLDNFLDLVTAVEIASLLVISEELIQEYEFRMHRYLTTLQEIYQDAPVCQNQHTALHLGDHMRGYGPGPGFRIFGTERFNYTLQSVNTNHHFSECVLGIFRGATDLHSSR